MEVYYVVRLLLRAGSSIHLVDSVEFYVIIGMLMDMFQRGRSALHCAAARGLNETVRLLIDYGADVNAQDKVHDCDYHAF